MRKNKQRHKSTLANNARHSWAHSGKFVGHGIASKAFKSETQNGATKRVAESAEFVMGIVCAIVRSINWQQRSESMQSKRAH